TGPTLLGTFNINYLYNTAGCQPTGSPNDSDPYFCVDTLGPGPFYINAVPGQYRVVVVSAANGGANAAVWSGDTSHADAHSGLPPCPGFSFNFTHSFGQIVLYAFDWAPFDNSPSQFTVVSLYQLSTTGPTITTTNLQDGTAGTVYSQ